jgi:ketosteroid isomerase-like protein
MPEEASAALRVALACHQAWTTNDLDLAFSYVADDIVCDAPAGRIEGRDAYRAFLTPFARMLISSSLIAAFGDQDKALMMYDTSSTLVADGPGAECLTVVLGKITHIRFIFDRVPFAAAREAMS